MNSTLNDTYLLGRLTRDPEEPQVFPSGKKKTVFGLAVPREITTKNGPDTDFFNIIAWDKLAEICYKHLKKGSQVLVKAKLQSGAYEERDTGKKRSTVDIVADKVKFLEPRAARDGSQEKPEQKPASPEYQDSRGPGDTLPF